MPAPWPSRGRLPALRHVISEPAEPVLRRAIGLLRPLLSRLTDRDWRHQERIPRTGGVLLAVNHISYFDPLAFGLYLVYAGRWPRFLGKASLFRAPVIGFVARNSGQIPVQRDSAAAAGSVTAAVEAVRAGKAVVIYPEGTITRDPDGWPMHPHSGVARIALAAGCPVIPVGQWGAQYVLPGPGVGRPRLWPRRTMHVQAGEPVELDDLRARPLDADVLHQASERIMDAITALVAELRGETPPEGRWDRHQNRRIVR